MARPTKINELLQLLSVNKDGLTWKQLLEKYELSFVEKGEVIREVLCFPAPTLDRLLKTLIKKGLVEKTYMRSGLKGRPMGKYKIWTDPNPAPGISGGSIHIMPNMERDEEGKLLLVRTVRDCKPRSIGDNRKNVKKTFPLGDYFVEVSSVLGDRGIKINPYKERCQR